MKQEEAPPGTRKAHPDPDEIVFSHLRGGRSGAAVKGALWSVLNSLLPTMLNGAIFVLSANLLLPAEFGLVSLSQAIVLAVLALGPASLGEALIQRREICRIHVNSVFWVLITTGVVLYGALCASALLIADLIHQPDLSALLFVGGLKIIADLACVVPNAIISRGMEFRLIALRTAVATVISGALCIALLLMGYGYWALAFGQVAASVATCVASFWVSRWRPDLLFRRSAIRELFRYGAFAFGTRLVQTLGADQLIIGVFLNPAALGVYNLARRVFLMLNDLVAGGLSAVTHVLLSSMQHDPAKARDAFLTATFGCSLVSFPVFIGLAAVSHDAVPLILGQHWHEAIWPIRLICLQGLLAGIGIIQASAINSSGRSDWWFYYSLSRNIATVLAVVLFFRHGVSAIVAGMVAFAWIMWPISVGMTSRLLRLKVVSYLQQFITPAMGSCALLMAVGGVWKVMEQANPTLRLAAEISAGSLTYAFVVLLFARKRTMALVSLALHRKSRKT